MHARVRSAVRALRPRFRRLLCLLLLLGRPLAVHADFASFSASATTDFAFLSLTDGDGNVLATVPDDLTVTLTTLGRSAAVYDSGATASAFASPDPDTNLDDVAWGIGASQHTEASVSGSASGPPGSRCMARAHGDIALSIENTSEDTTFILTFRATTTSSVSSSASGPDAIAGAFTIAWLDLLEDMGEFVDGTFQVDEDLDTSQWVSLSTEAPPGGSAGPHVRIMTSQLTIIPGASGTMVGLSVAQGVASTPEPGTAGLLLAGLGWACLSSRRRPRPAAPRAQA